MNQEEDQQAQDQEVDRVDNIVDGMVAGAIKRARHMALLPFTVERLR
jgi:ribosomal protein S18